MVKVQTLAQERNRKTGSEQGSQITENRGLSRTHHPYAMIPEQIGRDGWKQSDVTQGQQDRPIQRKAALVLVLPQIERED